MAVNIKKHIGARLREARESAGLTQEALAEKADKTVATISNLERGTVLTSITTLEQVGVCLGVPLAYFFDEIERSKKLSIARVRGEGRIRAVLGHLSDDQIEFAADFLDSLTGYSVSKKSAK